MCRPPTLQYTTLQYSIVRLLAGLLLLLLPALGRRAAQPGPRPLQANATVQRYSSAQPAPRPLL